MVSRGRHKTSDSRRCLLGWPVRYVVVMRQEKSSTETSETSARTSPRLIAVLALAWVFGTTLLFYTSVLPNSKLTSRLDFWLLLPDILPLALLPGPTSSLASIFERLPYWGIAASVVVSAFVIGDWIFRRLVDASSISWSIRIAIDGGLGLLAWTLVTLGLGWFGCLSPSLFWLILVATIAWAIVGERTACGDALSNFRAWRPTRKHMWLIAAVTPFVLALVFGASLPSVSFDNREYHLQGPKEFWEAGQIEFLEHNVYTSFPFLSEMLTLLGMVLTGDWWGGAIVGQVVISCFGLFTALLLVGTGRLIGPGIGGIAAVAWLTSPWCYRASSTIAFVEGALAFYVMATATAVILALRMSESRMWGVVGLLAGAGMSCKYPGLVQTVVPAGIVAGVMCLIGWRTREQRLAACSGLLWFIVGAAVAFGPWAIKNLVETGNPVYPLAYSLFGGIDLNDQWAAKWSAGHSPPFNVVAEPLHAVPDFFTKLSDVFIKNDWQTPLVAMFAPLALIVYFVRRQSAVLLCFVFALWLYAMWWALTHQIDRFWVPMLPVCCLLAGVGYRWPALVSADRTTPSDDTARIFSRVAGGLLVISLVYHWSFIASGQAGFHQWLTPYKVARRIAVGTEPGVKLLLEELPVDAKPLLIGEAMAFDLTHQPIYNTVFDESIFQRAVSADLKLPDADQPSASKSVICERLSSLGATHVFVNWDEVLRYRETYGYTDFVTPARLDDLVSMGVLSRVSVDPQKTHAMWDDVSDSRKREIERWGPELNVSIRGFEAVRRFDLFKVECRP